MSKYSNWEELADLLSLEIKKDIAEEYFTEKKYLEKAWEDYKQKAKDLEKYEEKIFQYTCRLVMMLRDEKLIEQFREITGFDLKACYFPYLLESETIKKRLFKKLKVPFAIRAKGKFVKLFLELYKKLAANIEEYNKKFTHYRQEYMDLVEETKRFNKRFDLSAMLSFFRKLSGEPSEEIFSSDDKTKVYEELTKKLAISIPPQPDQELPIFPSPRPYREISGELIKLAKIAFTQNKGFAKELLEIATQES